MISARTPAAVAPSTPREKLKNNTSEGRTFDWPQVAASGEKVSHVAAFYRLKGSAQTTSAYWNHRALITDVTESRLSCGH